MRAFRLSNALAAAMTLVACDASDSFNAEALSATAADHASYTESTTAHARDGDPTATEVAQQIGGTKTPPLAPKFHVYLLLGQSNMAGYPKALGADKVEDQRIRVLGYDNCAATGRQQGKWHVASPPLHECWNGALGPGDYFAKAMIEALPPGDTIGLVPCAISGEKIETFLKVGGAKYPWILQRAKLAQQAGGIIDGILFHQGESNCGDPAWPNKVRTLVQYLRKDLALGDVPFLAGELVPSGACARHNTLINKLPALIPQSFVVSAAGLGLDLTDTTWRLHFDHDAQVTLGRRYQAKMLEALGGK